MTKQVFSTSLAVALFVFAVTAPVEAAGLVQRGSRWVQFAQVDPPKTDQPAAPAPAPAQGAELKAVVVAAQGSVQVRQAEDQPWKQAARGDVLGPGAEIRTGLKSAIQIHIDPGHTITLDRLGVVKLINLVKNDAGIKTDVGMKYGRTRYDVEAGGAVHDAKIHTPGTTLAIRGTSTGTQSDAFTDATWVLHGVVDNTNKIRREMVRIDSSTGKAMVTTDLVTPTAFAKNKQKNDTKGEFSGRQLTDEKVVEQYASGELDDKQGGVEEAQRWARTEGFQFAAVGVAGDVFDLDLFWAPDSGVADLDLIIEDPLGATLDPKGTTIVRNGQPNQGAFTSSPIDDDGSLGSGFESAQFGNVVPVGNYLVTVRHISGDSATGFLDARLQSHGIFGTGNFAVDENNPQVQFLVNPQDKTLIEVGGH